MTACRSIRKFKSKPNILSALIGTGFLLQRPVGEGKAKIYLVSNKHVLFDAEKIEIAFTAIGKDGEPDIGKIMNFPITEIAKNSVGHPNPNVDIAVIECTGLFLMFPDKISAR